jgi:hypothetical protein
MSTTLQFEEPAILLGETRLRDGIHRFYLPLATVLSHSLIISRSGGGKSHTLATLAMGLAKAAAVRRLNLLAAVPKEVSQDKAVNLVAVVPNHPPLSLCVFDPHRDLAKRLLADLTRQIASVRVRRRKLPPFHNRTASKVPAWEAVLEAMLIYIDLGDRENVFGLNLLDTAMWESKENCASTLIEIFHRIYPEAWGSRMEDCFRHSVFALYLLNTQRTREQQFTILDIVPFITIDQWRAGLLDHPIIRTDNPVMVAWWKIQFADKMSDNFRNEVIKPVLNKLNPFLGSDILSRIFGQPQTTLDFEPLLRQGHLVLIDLAASEIETENCALAGAILIGFLLKKVRQIADSVGREADRPAVQLMVDEFNVILAAPYAEIMGQYRKWGVGVTLATQSLTLLDELDATLRPLVMANAANLLVLQVNAEDAEYLRRELVADGTTSRQAAGLSGLAGSLSSPSAGGGGFGPDLYDLVNAERGMCYLKGTFDNIREPVFTVRVAPRPFQDSPSDNEIVQEQTATVNRILERGRRQYTRPAGEVTAYLNEKQQDYLQLYRFEPLDRAKSGLLSGFVSWQTELAAGLERRLKLGQVALETERYQRAKQGRDRKDGSKANATAKKPRKGVDQNASERPQVNEEKPFVAKGEGQVYEAIPKYAPGYNVRAPRRKPVSRLQAFKETRQLPDGEDYRAAAQVKKQRQKAQARKRRNALRQIEAEQARQQGQDYAQPMPASCPVNSPDAVS